MEHYQGEPINRINTVIFKRGRDDNWEIGLQFNDGDLGIVDSHGFYVETIWDCKDWRGIYLETSVLENFEKLEKRDYY